MSTAGPDFRARLVATLRGASALFEVPGVLVVGSEVPNLLEPDARASLVVSLDLDIGVPVERHAEVKLRLPALRASGFAPSPDEPSVWLPADATRLELNFVGLDAKLRDAADTYVLEDPVLPLMVFGPLGFVRAGAVVAVDELAVPLPEPVGLTLEKLVTDRSGEKGDRDLLVALGLMLLLSDAEREQLVSELAALPDEPRHAVRSNLTLLSLLPGRTGMPDPSAGRALVHAILRRTEPAP